MDPGSSRENAADDYADKVYKRLGRIASGEETAKRADLDAIELFLTLADPYAAAILKPPKSGEIVLPANAKTSRLEDPAKLTTDELFRRAKDAEGRHSKPGTTNEGET